MTKKTATEPSRMDVVLKKAHTHAGKEYASGATITVTKDQAAWLKQQGVV